MDDEAILNALRELKGEGVGRTANNVATRLSEDSSAVEQALLRLITDGKVIYIKALWPGADPSTDSPGYYNPIGEPD